MSNTLRNSNIELLRILSMLMIIGHHYIFYGVQQNYCTAVANKIYESGSIVNQLFAQMVLPGGVVGVGIFFIIMGYFGIQSNHVRIVKIERTVWTYSIIGLSIYIITGLLGIIDLTGIEHKTLIALFPLISGEFWFATVYVIVLVMKPSLNRLINENSARVLIIICIATICVYSVSRFILSDYLGIINGIVFYFIGAYIKKSEFRFQHRGIYLLFAVMGWLGYVCFANIGSLGFGITIQSISSIIAICFFGTISAVFFFIFAISGKPFINRVINIVGKSLFPVYLLHENPLLRELLWSKILRVETFQYLSTWFPLKALISIIFVFAGCVIVDFLKKISIDSIIDRIVVKVRDWRHYKELKYEKNQ